MLSQPPRCVCSPASSTCRATGAAVAPPAPSCTSSTPTTIRGASAGANVANQASVLLASLWAEPQLSELDSFELDSPELFSELGEQVLAVFSSAVPVLPATVTPGIAAAVPVPERTTAIIRRRTVWATVALLTGVPATWAGGAAGLKVG